MSLTDTLNNTAGRFTTLVVGNKAANNTYCAQIINASNKMVAFRDVNTGTNRRVESKKILSAKSGRVKFSR